MNKKLLLFAIIFCACLGGVYAHIIGLSRNGLERGTKSGKVKKDEIVMDRHTLSDSFIAIFGEKSKTVVLQNIFDIGAPIGGGCDYYSMNYDDKQKLVDPFTRCPSMQRDINAPMYVKMNALRAGAVEKTCRKLTADQDMLSHALKMSQLNTDDAINSENIEKLHFIFHKSPVEKSQANVYKKWVSSVNPNASWAQVTYSICISPSWQIL